MQKLRLWPTDKQISQAINHSRHLACELAEFLGMIQHADISLKQNSLQILISAHEKEVSISKRKNQNENVHSAVYLLLQPLFYKMDFYYLLFQLFFLEHVLYQNFFLLLIQ